MTMETFKAATVNREESLVVIGGGEPTLHPLLFQMIEHARSVTRFVTIVTNGKRKRESLRLAAMAREGIISASLSRDHWHEPIDEEVVEAFRPAKRDRYSQDAITDLRGYASIYIPRRAGRCTFGIDSCFCDTLITRPDGSVKFCSCDDSPVIGSITEGIDWRYEEASDMHGCWREVVKDKELMEGLSLLTP